MFKIDRKTFEAPAGEAGEIGGEVSDAVDRGEGACSGVQTEKG
jgi:hypothetical protein